MNEKAFPFFLPVLFQQSTQQPAPARTEKAIPPFCYYYRINIVFLKKKYFPAPRLGVDVRRQPWIRR